MKSMNGQIILSDLDYQHHLRRLLRKNKLFLNITVISNICMSFYFLAIGSLILYAFNRVIENNKATAEELQLHTLFVALELTYILVIIAFSILALQLRNFSNKARIANIGLLILAIGHQIQLLIMFGTESMLLLLIIFVSGLLVQIVQLYFLTLHPQIKSIIKKYTYLIDNPITNTPSFPNESILVISPSYYYNWWV